MLTNYTKYITESQDLDYLRMTNERLKKFILNLENKYNLNRLFILNRSNPSRLQVLLYHIHHRVVFTIDYEYKNIIVFNNFGESFSCSYNDFDFLINKIENTLNFILTFDLKYINNNDLNRAMYMLNSFDLVENINNFNDNIIEIINKDNSIFNNFDNLRKYLNKENKEKLKHYLNANNFDLI